MKLSLYVYIIVAILFLSCEKDISLPDDSLTNIFNEWEWLYSYGGIPGNLLSNPGKVGYTKTIRFTKKGIYKEYKSNQKMLRLKYDITEKTPLIGSSRYIIEYINREDYIDQSIEIRGDTLFLYDQCFDNYYHVYLKK